MGAIVQAISKNGVTVPFLNHGTTSKLDISFFARSIYGERTLLDSAKKRFSNFLGETRPSKKREILMSIVSDLERAANKKGASPETYFFLGIAYTLSGRWGSATATASHLAENGQTGFAHHLSFFIWLKLGSTFMNTSQRDESNTLVPQNYREESKSCAQKAMVVRSEAQKALSVENLPPLARRIIYQE